jgi:hypothetical protein
MEQVPQVIARPHLGGVGPEEKPALYHEATVTKWSDPKKRVADGVRTHNHWSHNPVLCQLSYGHRADPTLLV